MATSDKITLPAEFSFALSPSPSAAVLSTEPVRSAHELLSQNSGLPYTTVVTIEHSGKVPLLDIHCERLAAGAFHLLRYKVDIDALSDALLKVCVRVGRPRSARGELQMVIVLVKGETAGLKALVHVSEVEGVWENEEMVDIEARGGPRNLPWIKDTAWVGERRPLEEARPEGVAETVLVGDDGEGGYCLLEGLVSNVFVLSQNSLLFTAPPEAVLPGSLRECVLSACAEVGVPVVERPPRLADYRQFATMFVSNAKCCLRPVRVLRIPVSDFHRDCPSEIELPNRPETLQLLDKIRDTVRQLLARYSADVYPKHNDKDNLTPARHA